MFKISKRKNIESENDKLFELSKSIFNDVDINCGLYIYLINSPYDVVIRCGEKIIGFYILDEKSLFECYGVEKYNIQINKEEYINKKGVKGFMMGVLPEFRNMGVGLKMIDYVNEKIKKEFDYIWGGHLKVLNNIEFWKKTRNIIGENDNSYITMLEFDKKIKI